MNTTTSLSKHKAYLYTHFPNIDIHSQTGEKQTYHVVLTNPKPALRVNL